MSARREPDAGVLDRNLARLLQRAWVPVLPRPAFRAELEGTWRAAARELARRRARGAAAIVEWADPLARGARPRAWRVRPSLLAAAAVALALALPRLLDRPGAPRATTLDGLLARGAVALRGLDGGSWQACAEGPEGLALAPPGALVVTPAGRGLRVVAPEGSLELAASTRASIALDGETLDVRLEGEVAAERSASPRAWRLANGRAAVRLDEGRLELALREGAGEARLVRGRARYERAGPDGSREEGALAAGAALALYPLAAPETAGAPLAAGGRRTLASAEGPGAAGPERPGAPALAGAVRDAQSGEPIRSFRVLVLDEQVGNEVEEPVVRAFDAPDGSFRWEAPARGRALVFVHAPGHAPAALGLHDLAEDVALGAVSLARGGTVRGHVVDAATGSPLPGALVLSERDAPAYGLPLALDEPPEWLAIRARSGADGSFTLAHASAGTHALRVTRPGYAPAWFEVAVAEGGTTDAGTRLLGAGGRLEGRARRPDGTAFADAYLIVTLMNDARTPRSAFAQARTDAEGRYAVGDLPPGQLLAVFLGDFREPPKVRPVEIEAGRTTRLDFPDRPEGTRLVGRIERSDGAPVAQRNLTLIADDATAPESDWIATTSDAGGRYAFESVAPGRASLLEVDAFGRWLVLIARIDVPAWPEVTLDLRQGTGAVVGRTLRETTDEPADTVLVLERLEDGRRLFAGFARSDADGSYALRGLPEGRYALTAYATGDALGFEAAEPFDLVEGAPPHALVFRHGPGATVEVRVLDASGAPVPGAMVELEDERGRRFSFDRRPLTDADGVHVAQGVRPGRFTVCVALAGREARAPLECRPGRREAVTIRLPDPGR